MVSVEYMVNCEQEVFGRFYYKPSHWKIIISFSLPPLFFLALCLRNQFLFITQKQKQNVNWIWMLDF